MTKPTPKVSIVVPIYNVEKYLRQCLDNILAQTFREIEVILVDDGSPDKCPQIVDEYAAKDERIVALHQPNGGYGVAVNKGIAAATGEYIGIIESDDWIEPDMYEKLYANALRNNSDVVKCSFYIFDETKEPAKQNNPWKDHQTGLFEAPTDAFTLADFPKIVMSHPSIWAALYRADFVKGIKVIESRSASYQDLPFICEVMSTAKRISVCKECLVHWRSVAEGNSTSQKGARLVMMVHQSIHSIEILKKNGVLGLCREEIYWHI